MSDDMGGDHGW